MPDTVAPLPPGFPIEVTVTNPRNLRRIAAALERMAYRLERGEARHVSGGMIWSGTKLTADIEFAYQGTSAENPAGAAR